MSGGLLEVRESSSKTQIDISIANILDKMSSRWTAKYSNEKIVIRDANKNKIVIETEISSKNPSKINLDPKHKSDLEKGKISSIIKMLVPYRFSELKENMLKNKILKSNNYEYVVYAPERYPTKGLIKGTIHSIGFSAMITLTPEKQIVEYMSPIHFCMNVIEKVVQGIDNQAKTKIAGFLNQPKGIQTWRMAGLILSNAMVFYDLISEKIVLLNGKKCKTLDSLHKEKNTITKKDLLLAWQNVLEYNYNPIFSVAIDILSTLETSESKKIIDALYTSSKKIREKKVAGSSDMYGKLLQKVIVDRDNLASYYTRPEAASLMAKLAVPEVNHPIYADNSVSKYRIADFACGTGLLLSSAYRQFLFNYEASNGKKISGIKLHKTLIEECFVGLDVLPIATHLAVSSLAMMFPTEIFGKTEVKTMPIGFQDTEIVYVKEKGSKSKIKKIRKEIKHYRLGSLDLIENITPTVIPSMEAVKGKKDKDDPLYPLWSIEESHHMISDESCDLIVMNPPFVRPTNHSGKHSGNAVPAFAAFGSSDDDQKEMGKLSGKKFKNTCAHGNAGLASNFIAVCDKKISKDGTMVLITPATISSGEAWKKTRTLLKKGYAITVISIARSQNTIEDRSFSSDTEMGEIILLAKKHPNIKTKRGLFISIYESPSSILSAIQIGNSIHNVVGVDKLETGNGGTTLRIGSTQVGSMLDCPIEHNWPFVNVVDPLLEQSAYKIGHGFDSKHVFSRLGSCFKMGLISRDISGGNLRGPFKELPIQENAKYVALWNNVQKQQTKMMVPPDKMLEPKKDATEKHIEQVWNTASFVHVNINPRYTSNCLIAAYTAVPAVGGRTWPSVIMDKKYEKPFVVWYNSTYGLLCFWSLTGKQQLGRGMTSPTAILNLPVPDFTKMSSKDLESMSRIYDRYHQTEFDRIKNLWTDKVRISIDDKVGEILGIKLDMDDIRVRLCMEPSISGGKPEPSLIKKHGEITR